jgi:nucleotide-binding universal stress UspA family protein
MKSYRIVVGVDGSEGGQRALRWAIHEAAVRGGSVTAVTAWTWAGIDASTITNPDDARRHVEDMLGKAIVKALNDDPRVPVATKVVLGAAGPTLVEAARDADLLVLGSHGHGRLFRAVVGSVAEECIRTATCPIVVLPVPRTERAEAQPSGIPAGIL